MASRTRDRITEYYRGKAAASLRLRLLLAIPLVVLACFLFTRTFLFPLRIGDASMEPTLRQGERYWFSIPRLGWRKPFTMNHPTVRWGASAALRRGTVVALTSPSLPASGAVANFFRFPLEVLSFGLWKPEATRLVVRRIVALPGESVVIRNKQIFINSQLYVPDWFIAYGEPQVLPERISVRDNMKEVYVPADTVFLLNDHWMSENDSRTFGPVPVWKLHGALLAGKK